MSGLIHAHSGLRWVVLILLLVALVNAFKGQKRREYVKKDKLINLFTMISLHTQLLIGLLLALIPNASGKVKYSGEWMKSELYRFFGMEHVLGMVIAIVIITIGRKKAESITAPEAKHAKILKWYLFGLLFILASIPWPFRAALGGHWF